MLEEFRRQAQAADSQAVWPSASWELARKAEVPAWSIPTAFGGKGMSGPELLESYESLASACLTTCFILSQRDAAVRRIVDSGNDELAQELLPPLARGETFATVGLSQLTTSRQHGRPVLTARLEGDDVLLDGVMPWVTGASAANHFITGAVLEDGRQILTALPGELPGLKIGSAMELMALEGSMTAEVRCEAVRFPRRWILAGPAERVMAGGRGGTGGLETSCLALGLARAAIDYLREESSARPELSENASRLEHAFRMLKEEMHHLAQTGSTPEAAASLRGRANTLVLRATQIALTAAKGIGFLRQHPAQRWARQALFFLVWSCPRQAAEATLEYLAPPVGIECPLV